MHHRWMRLRCSQGLWLNAPECTSASLIGLSLYFFGPLIKTLNLSCLLLKECIDR